MSNSLGAALFAASVLFSTASFSAPASLDTARPLAISRSAPMAGANGRMPSAAELRQIYSGHTWIWSEGGGYFAPNGSFSGVVGHSAKTAFMARGSWSTGSQGEMCFKALWQGQVGRNDSKTCFYHKLQGGNLLQKKGEAGTWYTFKSARTRKGDEFNKLASGNRIGDKLSDIHSKYLSGIPM